MQWRSSFVMSRLVFGCTVLVLTSATYPEAKPKRYGESKPKFMPSEPGKPPSCLKDPRLTYCEDPDDYPKDRILYLLQNNMFNMNSLLMDETRDTYTFESMEPPKPMYSYLPPPPQKGYLPPTSNYNSSMHGRYPAQSQSPSNSGNHQRHRRQASNVGAEDLCPSRASYITPRAAQSIQGDWMFLVNLDDTPQYTQLVRSETCIRSRCSGSCQAAPGSVAVCQQQFVQKRLVALAGTGQQLNQDIFWFPSCCVCKIRTL